jgi:hypothetical protein
MRYAKEYTSLCLLGRGDCVSLLMKVSSRLNNSGAAQAVAPAFASVYTHDRLVNPPNITERPKSVSMALSSLLIRTLSFRRRQSSMCPV